MTNEELAKCIYSGQNELLGMLYNQNSKLIYKLARNFYRRYSERLGRCGVEFDDVLSECFFVLPEAVKAYCESDSGYRFVTFLKYPLMNCFKTLLGVRTKAEQKEPLNSAVSLDSPIGNDMEDLTLGDTVADEKAEFEDDTLYNITLSGVFGAVKEALKDKPLLYDVIHMKYAQGMTQTQISEKLGCSGNYVHTLIYQAMRKLRQPHAKIIQEYRDEIIGMSLHMGGLSHFKNTGTSSVEWAAEKLARHASDCGLDERG